MPAPLRSPYSLPAVTKPTLGALERVQLRDLVEHVVAVTVAQAVQTAGDAAAVDHHVEAVEGPEHPLRVAEGLVADLDGDRLDLGVPGVAAERRGRDAVEAAVLV